MLVGATTTKASCQMLSGLIAYLALYQVPRFTGKTRITGKTDKYRKDQRIYRTLDHFMYKGSDEPIVLPEILLLQ